MILIDLSKPTQMIVFYSPLTDTSVFNMEIKPESGSKSHSFQLETNLSGFVERSFIYELPTDLFDGLQGGLYDYSILTTTDAIATKGKLMIKGIDVNDDVIAPDWQNEDDIIFNG